MRSRRRKRRSFGPLLAVVFLLLLIAGAAAGFVIGRRYMPGKEMADKAELFHIKGSQVAILLNNELQEEKGIYEDGQVYLPISWVNEYVNERFYWDETEKLLVYALPEEIVYADESDMGEQGPLLKVKEGEAYLSLGLIMNYSDIRQQSFDTSQIKRVFIDTVWGTVKTAQVRKKSILRVKGGIKSDIITELSEKSTVQVLESMDKWSKVRTVISDMCRTGVWKRNRRSRLKVSLKRRFIQAFPWVKRCVWDSIRLPERKQTALLRNMHRRQRG